MTDIGQMMASYFAQPDVAAQMAERERDRQERARGVIERYGSEDAVFADTPKELALKAACEAVPGFNEDDWLNISDAAVAATMNAWPLPGSLAAAWAEFQEADALEQDRYTVCPDYSAWAYVEARRKLIERLLDEAPARSKADLLARLAWFAYRRERDLQPSEGLIAAIQQDVERLVPDEVAQ